LPWQALNGSIEVVVLETHAHLMKFAIECLLDAGANSSGSISKTARLSWEWNTNMAITRGRHAGSCITIGDFG
jgi:hypothetical protein